MVFRLVLRADGVPFDLESRLRSVLAKTFLSKPIDNFLGRNELSYILRAHTSLTEGIDISKGCRVFTIFSTSKDHGGGPEATCGCVLIDSEQILVINRTANYEKYKAKHKGSLEKVGDTPPDDPTCRRRPSD